MNILLIGSGGREHALARGLSLSQSIDNLFCSTGNPGIFKHAKQTELNISDHAAIAGFCMKNSIDMVVVGPEQPLADGIADSLRNVGISVFGPSGKASLLESSKGFAKEFMKRHDIPTAAFKTFTALQSVDAHKHLDMQSLPIVLKADGLAAGKGVIVAQTIDEAHEALDKMFAGMFGESSKTVVIEEFLKGEEASILAISDGKDFITLASSQDHKRALDGDRGKNTGGMGAYAPAPIVDEELTQMISDKIMSPALKGIADEGAPFIGCLYAGLMIDSGEPRVVEFNVRFGDPEAQAVLPVFDGDFAKLLYSAAQGSLDKSAVRSVAKGHACSVVLASEGYPGKYQKGFPISGIKKAEQEGAIVYQAGTAVKNNRLVTSGGRVLAVTGTGNSLKEAIDNSYKAVNAIHFENKFFRTDIGAKGLKHVNI